MMELYRSLSESFRSQQEYDGKKYFCTISAGSASYPEDASGYTELSEYASHSLKYAKKLSRNRIVFFSRAILEQEMRSLELVELLRESIERQFEGFELVYQPQIAVDTRHVVGAEALARWTCTLRPVPRRVYPPVGAERGSSSPAGGYSAAAQCKAYGRKSRLIFKISINLSYLQSRFKQHGSVYQQHVGRLDLSPANLDG